MDKRLCEMIDSSENIVFFGGAGVSTASGIPDFRSADGLYSQKGGVYPPEKILSHGFFMSKTALFYEFYKAHMLCLTAKPNACHFTLSRLEKEGKLKAVVTQNIDGLHQSAGSKRVYELHGSVHRNHCMSCGKAFDAEYVLNSKDIPLCDGCGGIIKPDVVLYDEQLDDRTVRSAVEAIARADMLIIGGTSLTVYPAASFIDYYRGNRLVLINKTPTPADSYADLHIAGNIAEIMG